MSDELAEFSVNFDAEDVEPFLGRISPLVASGFGTSEIAQVVALLNDLEVNEEKEIVFPIVYAGQPSEFRVSIFMDDIDASDLYIFSHPALIKQIFSEMKRFAEELGK